MNWLMMNLFAVSLLFNVFYLLYAVPKAKRETAWYKRRAEYAERLLSDKEDQENGLVSSQ
jgi:hypothetical protein